MKGIKSGLLAGLLLAVLTSCQTAPAISPSARPTTAPHNRFGSKQEAEDAARTVYKAYLAASDEIGRSGGAGLDRLSPYVTAAELNQEREGVDLLRKKNLHIAGSSKLSAFKIQSADLKNGAVSAYACVDVGSTRVLTSARKDVTPGGRQDRQTSVAEFVWQGGRLRLNGTSPWSGEPLC